MAATANVAPSGTHAPSTRHPLPPPTLFLIPLSFSPSSSAPQSSSRPALPALHRQPRLLRTRAVRVASVKRIQRDKWPPTFAPHCARDSHSRARPSLGPNLTPILRYSTPPHRAPPAQIAHSLPISHGRVLRPLSLRRPPAPGAIESSLSLRIARCEGPTRLPTSPDDDTR